MQMRTQEKSICTQDPRSSHITLLQCLYGGVWVTNVKMISFPWPTQWFQPKVVFWLQLRTSISSSFLDKANFKKLSFPLMVQEKAELDLKKLRQSAVYRGKPSADLHRGLQSPNNSMKKVRLISVPPTSLYDEVDFMVNRRCIELQNFAVICNLELYWRKLNS